MLTKDFVPLYQALVWIIFWLLLAYRFRSSLKAVADALIERIHAGSQVIVGPVTLGPPPKELRENSPGSVATSDADADVPLPRELTPQGINDRYKKLLSDEYFLLHASEIVRPRTTPKSGRYRVRIWIESYHDKPLDDIIKVTYRVWDDFRPPIRTTSSKVTDFDLWVSLYGEFPILAYVERRDKPGVWLSRYIDLPNRPPD